MKMKMKKNKNFKLVGLIKIKLIKKIKIKKILENQIEKLEKIKFYNFILNIDTIKLN